MESSPVISAVMPLFHGMNYIEESLRSIQSQTFYDWEFIIVNEPSDDGAIDIIQEYASRDKRIRLINNQKREGLSQSLNIGIAIAKGKYIARVDVDDPSDANRFMRQFEFMENNEDVFLCGTLTKSVLPNVSYILNVPCEVEDLKAALMFGCEISHCSVMFRREEWVLSGYSYNPNSLCEDYDLWTRIMFEKKIVNMREVLVNHRWGFSNISIAKGKNLIRAACEVSRRTIKNAFGVEMTGDDMLPLYSGWRSMPREFAKNNTSRFLHSMYYLLVGMEESNKENEIISYEAMCRMLWNRWNYGCECCGLSFKKYTYESVTHEDCEAPEVTILMPVSNSVFTIREAIDSIIEQEYENYEFLIICENDSEDGSFEIAKFISMYDKRLRVFRNDSHLGLAASLNKGIDMARGKYIARIDADDISNKERIGCQLEYMETHPLVGACQSDQHYFGVGTRNFTHTPQRDTNDLKANLLFFCDACHSTVFIRKSILDKYNLRYNENSCIEDYDLWTRLVSYSDFVTIPKVYGEYRVSYQNKSVETQYEIQNEMCDITLSLLRANLSIDIPENQRVILGGYMNPYLSMSPEEKTKSIDQLRGILLQIWNANQKMHYYKESSLKKAIVKKWLWSLNGKSWHEENSEKDIQDVLYSIGIKKSKGISVFSRTTLLKPLKGLQSIQVHLFAKNMEHLSNVIKDTTLARAISINDKTKYWTWERYKRVDVRLRELEQQNRILVNMAVENLYAENRIPFTLGEKIRIIFIYQIPSIWISWESFYQACILDDRIDCRLLLLEETETEKTQMKGAREFLEEQGITYTDYDSFDLDSFSPHFVVMQTPYDKWHRKRMHRSSVFKARGCRILYIPYGIEISDTEDSHRLHFEEDVVQNSYRIFTFSDQMRCDYNKYCMNRRAVRVTGLPRMDYYATHQKGNGTFNSGVLLWKVHFPKWISEKGQDVLVTPSLEEYLSFANWIRSNPSLHVIFMPHPKFFENSFGKETAAIVLSIVRILSTTTNCEIASGDAYWKKIIEADYAITDRSSVMVELGALSIPVMYMSNESFEEPVTMAIKPLMDSYYKGKTAEDMIRFVKQCRDGVDPLHDIRRRKFLECFPLFDGKAGERIKDEIIHSIMEEGY